MSRRLALLAALVLATPLAAQQRPAAPAATTPRPGTAAPQRPVRPESVLAADSTIKPIEYRREVYNYQGGPRDPFTSLLTDETVQTSIGDLRLVGVLYDPRGGSIAMVRDRTTNTAHRLRRGQSLGRLRVIQIRPYEVVFQIEEFGFERQEVLTLQRPGEVNR